MYQPRDDFEGKQDQDKALLACGFLDNRPVPSLRMPTGLVEALGREMDAWVAACGPDRSGDRCNNATIVLQYPHLCLVGYFDGQRGDSGGSNSTRRTSTNTSLGLAISNPEHNIASTDLSKSDRKSAIKRSMLISTSPLMRCKPYSESADVF